MRDLLKMVSVLFIACGLAAASLAVVNMVTHERISRWEKQRKELALKAVLVDADEFKTLKEGKVWEARRHGQALGHAFLAEIQGYSGPITLMFGVDNDGAITGLEILGHTETPGLGARIASAAFRDQFRKKRVEQIKLKKDDAQTGQIDAITGATISSRAVANAVRTAIDSFNKEDGGGGK